MEKFPGDVLAIRFFQSLDKKGLQTANFYAEKSLTSVGLMKRVDSLSRMIYWAKREDKRTELASFATLAFKKALDPAWVEELIVALKNSKVYRSSMYQLFESDKIAVDSFQNSTGTMFDDRIGCCFTSTDLLKLSQRDISATSTSKPQIESESQTSSIEVEEI